MRLQVKRRKKQQRQDQHETVIALQGHRPEEEGRQGEQMPAEAEGEDQEPEHPDRPHGHGLDVAG